MLDTNKYNHCRYWNITYSNTQTTKTTKKTQSTQKTTPTGQTVYVTPTGKRYHYSPTCGGKNSKASTLANAKSMGLTPCKKCAQ